jgi:hypothetical protein
MVTNEKRKKKGNEQRDSNKRSKANQRKRARSLEEENLGPLRQGLWLDTNKINFKKRSQTTKAKLKNQKKLPLHTCKLPLNQCNPLNKCIPSSSQNRAFVSAQL